MFSLSGVCSLDSDVRAQGSRDSSVHGPWSGWFVEKHPSGWQSCLNSPSSAALDATFGPVISTEPEPFACFPESLCKLILSLAVAAPLA